MRKLKRPRGFYKELSLAYKELGRKMKKTAYWEIWLKHLSDPSKDIRFLVPYYNHKQFFEAHVYISKQSNSEYESQFWTRTIDQPRTRRAKAIFKSQCYFIPLFSEIEW